MEYGTDITRQDLHDHIIGSGCIGEWSWYEEVIRDIQPTYRDDNWSVTILMEDPEYDDEQITVFLDPETLLDMMRNLVNDDAVGKYGESKNYKASQETRRQCGLVFDSPDDVDFDADTADQVIQCIAYGEVIFS